MFHVSVSAMMAIMQTRLGWQPRSETRQPGSPASTEHRQGPAETRLNIPHSHQTWAGEGWSGLREQCNDTCMITIRMRNMTKW